MKKLLIITLGLFFFSSQAQNDKEFGVYLGSVISHPNEKSLLGEELGIYYKKNVFSKFSFVSGLNYRSQLQRESFHLPLENYINNYLSIPVGLEYCFKDQAFIGLGADFDLLMSAKRKRLDQFDQAIDVKKYYNFGDIGVYFNIGYQVKRSVNINIKYHIGFVDKLVKPENFGYTQNNTFLSLSIGYNLVKE
ncbi:MAG: hypothetical protein N4A45_01495 [Flavobacteriales bacterium]|jgi:hypothetical protein|nr:hypothetical protein [Flavobacteriales bacterium]